MVPIGKRPDDLGFQLSTETDSCVAVVLYKVQVLVQVQVASHFRFAFKQMQKKKNCHIIKSAFDISTTPLI